MIKPLDNYVVLKEEVDTLTESGILVGEKANLDKPNFAQIVACGPDVKRVKKGDKVLFKYHLFDEINLGDLVKEDKYLVGKDEGIVALC